MKMVCKITLNRTCQPRIHRHSCPLCLRFVARQIHSSFILGFRVKRSLRRMARWTSAAVWTTCTKWCSWSSKPLKKMQVTLRQKNAFASKLRQLDTICKTLEAWKKLTGKTRKTRKTRKIDSLSEMHFFRRWETTACCTKPQFTWRCITIHRNSKTLKFGMMITLASVCRFCENPTHWRWTRVCICNLQTWMIFLRWNGIPNRINWARMICCILWITAAVLAHSLETWANGQKTLKTWWTMQLKEPIRCC